ncbi:hypothetical protein Cob_v001724 [Colletotrichum orbiculare MAFF 240422]|uniref:Uncharacterized protein n=1 Tax=Colletotrichum orbiculare (strain 104-T / ATCC 96160 / CBS 514.97 / LARS 414 / MAFF 240422) TaxID=1213857 RepID=A0A484G6K2_COLOR|nr:hypothetical protein Cob_v001724 [Colletotrichum orbiculare MAFF 240422]
MAGLNMNMGILRLTMMQVILCGSVLALFHQQHVRLHLTEKEIDTVGKLSVRPFILDSRDDLKCLTETTNFTVTIRVTRGAQATGANTAAVPVITSSTSDNRGCAQ